MTRLALSIAALLLMAATASATDQGFGVNPGGSGYPVVHVTNLNDSGPGSLRDALGAGNRTIVFDVSGDLWLTDFLFVNGDHVTIDGAGQSVILRNYGLVIRGLTHGAHDVIVRNLSVWDSALDCVQVSYGAYNVMIDHVSTHGCGDGSIDITGGDSDSQFVDPLLYHTHHVTVQWSILSNPASERNMLVAYNATEVSLHHNVFAFSSDRNPLVKMNEVGTACPTILADLKNNLILQWGDGRGMAFDSHGCANVVKNEFWNPEGPDFADVIEESGVTGVYVSGNLSADTAIDWNSFKTHATLWPAAFVTTKTANYAVCDLQAVGGSGRVPRDSQDDVVIQFITFYGSPCPL